MNNEIKGLIKSLVDLLPGQGIGLIPIQESPRQMSPTIVRPPLAMVPLHVLPCPCLLALLEVLEHLDAQFERQHGGRVGPELRRKDDFARVDVVVVFGHWAWGPAVLPWHLVVAAKMLRTTPAALANPFEDC